MPADPRPILTGFMPMPDQQKRLVRRAVEARLPAAQRRTLTPPTPEDRPKPSPVSDAHQGSFYSSGG